MNIDWRARREAIAKVALAISVVVMIVAMLVVTHQGLLQYVHRR